VQVFVLRVMVSPLFWNFFLLFSDVGGLGVFGDVCWGFIGSDGDGMD